jgi:hypothetical protein
MSKLFIHGAVGGHGLISPSMLPSIVKCPGMLTLILNRKMEHALAGYKRKTKSASHGNKVHKEIEKAILGDVSALTDPLSFAMWNNLSLYASRYFEVDKLIGAEVPMLIDIGFTFNGTADLIFIANNIMHIVDLKSGRMIVKAFENYQLLSMAWGVKCWMTKRKMEVPENWNLTIIGREYNPIDTWSLTSNQIDEEVKKMKALLLKALRTPEFIESGQCAWCDVSDICPLHVGGVKNEE